MEQPQAVDPHEAVNAAIQTLTARRLGRGFVPFGLLFAWGLAGAFFGGGLLLPGGAVAASAAMLAYGLRTVQRALGRPDRPWMVVALLTSVIPPAFSVYVLAWVGLRGFTLGTSAGPLMSAVVGSVLGAWALSSWMKVVEIERLARIMTMNLDGEGGAA